MTIEKARKLLGSSYDSLSEEKLKELIKLLELFSNLCIDNMYESTKK